MSDELKPCPFCGGEAKIESTSDQMGHLVLTGYIVRCSQCWCAPKPNNYDGNRQNAIDRWNARAERTCHRVVEVPAERGGGQPALRAVCSECGDKLGVTAAFCKRCGAKVVG